jgi:hypothetical protein
MHAKIQVQLDQYKRILTVTETVRQEINELPCHAIALENFLFHMFRR